MSAVRFGAWARLACLALIIGGLRAAAAMAQSVLDFDDWMQRIDEGSQSLQRHIAARDPVAARESAREIEELYGLMETFFEKRGDSADAVRWSRDGRVSARRALIELAARRFVQARRHALAIAHGCRDCHVNYKPL
jgi:hypothetical protein